MTLRLEQPAWLWILALAIPMIAAGAWWFATLTPVRRVLSVILRTILVTVLALAMAGLSSSREADRFAAIAVVDVSDSVRAFGSSGDSANADTSVENVNAIERARRFLREASTGRKADDLLGVVVFDGSAIAASAPTRGDALDRSLDIRLHEGTDIEGALRLAASLVPRDAVGRLILITDGNQTAGDAARAADAIASNSTAQFPIDVVPVRYSIAHEVRVVSLDVPSASPADTIVTARVVLESAAPVTGVLRLTDNSQPLVLGNDAEGNPATARRLRLSAGRHVETVEIRLPADRVHRMRAEFTPEPDPSGAPVDTLAENNAAEAVTTTPGVSSVLIVDGSRAGSGGGPLAQVLERRGLRVTSVTPESMPTDLLTLQGYDLVILDNCPADDFDQAAQRNLSTFVRELGGGLIMTGGKQAFISGGWRGSLLEPILPVRLDSPNKILEPMVATVLVTDSSGSMAWPVFGSNKSKQQLANEAAALAIRSIDPLDMVGLIAFNNQPEVVIPLAPNADPAANSDKAMRVHPDGGTNIPPALDLAASQLGTTKAAVKHIIVLTDGRSQGRDFLPEQCARLSKKGIRVSTIAVGADADTEMMEQMASRGGGEYFFVSSASALPRIFLKAIRVARAPAYREEVFQPLLMPTGAPATVGLSALPPLNGLCLTEFRRDATVSNDIVSEQGEPLLSTWAVELGRVAAFTSDTGTPSGDSSHAWADTWLDWPGYETMWSQLARAIARPATSVSFTTTTTNEGGRTRIRLESIDDSLLAPDAGPLTMKGSVYAGNSTMADLSFTPVGPGVFEATIPTPNSSDGPAIIIARPTRMPNANSSNTDRASALSPVIVGVSPPASAELASLTSNNTLLEQIANRSGGRVLDLNDPAARLFVRAGVPPRFAVTPLTMPLLAWAIVLLMLDIANRRVAWDRLFSTDEIRETQRALEEKSRKAAAGVGAALGSVRGTRTDAHDPLVSTSLTLSEEDARRLRDQARENRRAARMAQQSQSTPNATPPIETATRTSTTTPVESSPSPMDSTQEKREESSDLLAAKRRASKRFEEN
ncbi:MAG: VWA domain-containing protein [Phycisphaerales bacterium]